ncbi:GNAT family N-acetyltransferase [Tenacibaculum retecalamus]|uniref:GNAT family N-acetyltransferase n=1 Tax=Tenacibaculum retecalamus TaxID=3018315 RepID=UPI0023D93459|nr:GNAT family N-acetyltransferase [Tenacibaculum retecalamus]WBX71809.1 GNAT family N-acetyltransferase [Tenacibaculum retecalamus]
MKKKIAEIKQITISEVLPIRHKVMWPDKPMSYVELPNDEKGKHFGLFVNGEITSIISLFISNNEAQFRKFATLIEHQGFGYGTILLNKVIDLVKKEKVAKLWCNARVEKSKFYERFDLTSTTKKFKKGGIEYVIMERNFHN